MGRRIVGIGVLVCGIAMTGCGGGTSPEDYAAAICDSGGDWVNSLQSRADELQSTVDSATPEEGKQILLDFLDGTIDDTDELLAEIEEAGEPDVENGERFASAVSDAFDEARAGLVSAREEVEQLPTDDPQTFGQKASELGSLLGQVLSNFEPPENEEMEQAFEDAPSCDDVVG